MGLDLVELVMEIEDEFGFDLPDADAERISTVGQTAAYVISRLRQQAPPPIDYCPTSRAFHRVRKQLQSRFGVSRRAVTPSSRIGDLVRTRVHRFEWNEVARACGLRKMYGGCFFTPAFPQPSMTLRDLIYSRIEGKDSKRQSFYRPNGAVNERLVWRRVQYIVGEQLGVDVNELKWDTHYINDLHAD